MTMPATPRLAAAAVEPLTVGSLGLLALALVDPSDAGPSLCPSAVVFGVACPLCGLTRGVSRLVRGDLATSWDMHPMAGPVLAVAAGAWMVWIGVRLGLWARPRPLVGRLAVVGLCLALLTVWIVRGVSGTLPPI